MKKHKNAPNSKAAPPPSPSIWIWWALLVFAFAFGGSLIWLFTRPYTQALQAVSWFSPDRHLASFTPDVFNFLQPIGWILASFLLITGICLLTFRVKTRQLVAAYLVRLAVLIKRLPRDAALLWQDHRPRRADLPYLAAVLLLMAAAVLVRLFFLDYPMRYDESYTVVVFAMRPWLNLISDYHLPNNHILHTILVKLAINLFGTAPWAVRFPAFLSGILCIPAAYVLARQFYGKISAFLSAGLLTFLPLMISYSTNARGYSQYMLFSLVLFSLAVYLRKHINLAGWGLFTLFSVAGFYTVPFMLYPFGAICFWLILSAAFGETHVAYRSFSRFLKYLFTSGFIAGLFTVLLYSPIVIFGTGLDSIVGNLSAPHMSWIVFWAGYWEQFKSAWVNWNFDLPQIVSVLLAVGVFLSLCFHHWISRVKIPSQITTIIWILGVSVFLRHIPLDRIWLFLMPFWLIWACGGLIAPFNHLRHPWKKLQSGLVIVCLSVTAFWSVRRVHSYFPGWNSDPGKIELAAEYLSKNLKSGDAVAVVFPYDAQYWYYLGQFGIADESMHHIELDTHQRVFAIVTEQYAQTPALVLQAHALSPEEYQVVEAELVYSINDQEIYLCLHR